MKMTKAEFASLMAKLRAHYQNGIADEALWLASVSQYWEDLGSEDPEALRRAFTASWREHPDWMPSAGQIAKLLDGGLSPESRAISAWPEVLELTRSSSDDHSDPVAAETMRLMGGGKRLGQTDSTELEKWGRREFERVYTSVAEKWARDTDRPMLTNDDSNRLEGPR